MCGVFMEGETWEKQRFELKSAEDPWWKNASKSEIRMLSHQRNKRYVAFIMQQYSEKFYKRSQDNYFNAFSDVYCYEDRW